MPKNLIVCCDGTTNQYTRDRTNVIKLFYTLVHEPARQITYYHPGLGTMEPPGALTRIVSWWTRFKGAAIGYGLSADIRDAYIFIMNNFEEGDRVFLFGFSRGAYTARAVASLLHMYGLLGRHNEPLVPYAIRMMNALHAMQASGDQKKEGEVFALANGFKATFSRECKPYFVGVWDTVSSVGWVSHPVRIPFSSNNPDIQVARHAVAIDERRTFFPQNLWRPKEPLSDPKSGPKNLKQVWFPGSHADVGGGYPEKQSGPSKFALEWMLVEARKEGLLLDQQRVDVIMGKIGQHYVPPDATQPLHDSLVGGWKLLEYYPKKYYDYATGKQFRRMNRGRRRTMPPGSLVHESAYMRGSEYSGRLPLDTQMEPRVPI